jgi:hypothetical protein
MELSLVLKLEKAIVEYIREFKHAILEKSYLEQYILGSNTNIVEAFGVHSQYLIREWITDNLQYWRDWMSEEKANSDYSSSEDCSNISSL